MYVGLLTRVALILFPLKSYHVDPDPGYDAGLLASKFNINPPETIGVGVTGVVVGLGVNVGVVVGVGVSVRVGVGVGLRGKYKVCTRADKDPV